MHPDTWKFCKVVYTVVILWCCLIRVNGYPYTYVYSTIDPYSDLTSGPVNVVSDARNGYPYTYGYSSIDPYTDTTRDPVNVVSDAQNERKVKSPNSLLSLHMNARSINFNIPITAPDLNAKEIEHETHKASIKKVRGDYTLTEGIGYHKLHKSKLTWNEARKACMTENAQLTVINSAKEDKLLRELIRVNTETDTEYQVFIGVHDMFEEGDWVTVRGESLDSTGYNVWASEEPNSYQGMDEDCVALDKNRGMNDEPCYLEYYYICEIPE